MSAFQLPLNTDKGKTDAHFGDRRRIVAITLPESFGALMAAVRRRYPTMNYPIQLFLNEGATKPLNEETFHTIANGDTLIALDKDGEKVSVAGAFQDNWTTETQASYVATPARPPSEAPKHTDPYREDHLRVLFSNKDDRDWKTEARAQWVKKDAEAAKPVMSVDPWRTDHMHMASTDDRDWKTEARAQYVKKDAKAAKPVTSVDPWRTDHTYIAPKDDRDWKTEANAQYIKKNVEAVKPVTSVDPWRSNNLHIMPEDDRDWKTEARSQYVKKNGELAKPVTSVDPWRTDHTYIPPTDDRDWKTEASAEYGAKKNEVKVIYLEPDLESSVVKQM